MTIYVLMRENYFDENGHPMPKDHKYRFLPVTCHWDLEWLKKMESKSNTERFFVVNGYVDENQ